MSNSAFKANIVKIGMSDRDPSHFRYAELSTTGVPDPFFVEYYAFTIEPEKLEKDVHDHLSTFRRSQNREFFNISAKDAISAIKKIGESRIKFEEEFHNQPAASKSLEGRTLASICPPITFESDVLSETEFVGLLDQRSSEFVDPSSLRTKIRYQIGVLRSKGVTNPYDIYLALKKIGII
jgi:hypothetical protein